MDKDTKIATRQSFGEALKELGEKNGKIVVLDADLAGATKTNIFGKAFPDRFFDMGIAEQDMIGTAAGLASCGKIPYAASFAAFATGRSYDQIRSSVCYPKANVKICGTHAGVTVGEDGATHQMLEDLSLMRGLPNMTVICPSDDTQTRWAVEEVSKFEGPVYLRLSRAATPVIYDAGTEMTRSIVEKLQEELKTYNLFLPLEVIQKKIDRFIEFGLLDQNFKEYKIHV